MNDSLILFEGCEAATITASAGSATGFPTDNLKDRRYSTLWKSGGTIAGQSIRCAISRVSDYILILNHNFNSLGLTSLTIESGPFGILATVVAFPDFLYIPLASNTYTLLDLVFNKGSALTFAPQCGMIFFGKKAALPLYLNNPQRGLESNVIHDESLSGLLYRTAPNGVRQTWKLDYGALKQPANAEVWRWLNSVGVDLYPFWLRDMDDHWHFVGLQSGKVSGGSKGNVIFDLRNLILAEERVGIPMELPGNYTV